MDTKYCENCKFCVEQDNGYSNYTIEGTEVDCLLGLNKSFPVDRWYGKEPAIEYANECGRFSEGESVHIDVDKEDGDIENYSDDPEIKSLLKKWESSY